MTAPVDPIELLAKIHNIVGYTGQMETDAWPIEIRAELRATLKDAGYRLVSAQGKFGAVLVAQKPILKPETVEDGWCRDEVGLDHRWAKSEFSDGVFCTKCGAHKHGTPSVASVIREAFDEYSNASPETKAKFQDWLKTEVAHNETDRSSD